MRAITLAVVTVLLLSLATWSSPSRPRLEQLGLFGRVESGGLPLTVVADAVIATGNGAVSAFDFDGTQRWSYRSEDPVDYAYVSYAPVHEVFLVSTMGLSVGRDGRQQLAPVKVVALDRRTGARRWHLDGSTWQLDELLVSMDRTTIRVYQGDPPMIRWQSGRFATIGVDRDGGRAWGLTDNGTLSEMDLRTGEVRRSRKIGEAGEIRAVGDRVFIHGEGGQITAYDVSTLERLPWNAEWMPMEECGPVICATMSAPNLLPSGGGIDRQTGQPLWSLPANQWLRHSAAGILAVRLGEVNGHAPTVGLIDPMTGRVRLEMDGWQIHYGGGDLLMRQEQGRMYFARLGPDGPRVLGSVPHIMQACHSSPDVFMCELTDGRVGVWRLAP